MAHEHEYDHGQFHGHTHENGALAETGHPHTHDHEHDHVTEQDREHSHYAHFHSPEEKKRQLNRISRIIGHLQHVKRLIEADEDCADVLTQLSATRSAITGLGKEIMNEHILHCISHALEDGDTSALEDFKKAIEKFF